MTDRTTETPIRATGAVASALAVATTGVNFTLPQTVPYVQPVKQFGATVIDHTLVDAKIEARTADLRGDVRLNTQGLSDLAKRVDDLNGRLASVPTDLATLKATVAELPRKGFIIAATTGALTLLAALSGYIQWIMAARIASGVAP